MTAPGLFGALTRSPQSRLYVGTRWSGHGTPGGTYRATKLAWIDRSVGGVRNGIERSLPRVVTHTSDGAGELDFTPAPEVRSVALTSAGSFGLVPGSAATALSAPVPFSDLGTESAAVGALSSGLGSSHVILQSGVPTRDVQLYGSPVVRVKLATGRTWTVLTPSVVDVDPATRVGGRAGGGSGGRRRGHPRLA